ncbi:MAG: radical SAM/SPASM domain-containing protein [Planctomycetota bacterium]|jgi:MoaA/NifB/PqqE/SkfB family radical SAM enzyme
MISNAANHENDGWSKWAVALAAKGAYWVLRVPVLRNFFLGTFLGRVKTAFEDTEDDPEKFRDTSWVASHLDKFLDRLFRERPSASKAVLRFLAAYVHDVYKRAEAERADKPCPITVVIEPTDRCNLNCPGCYAKSTRDGCDLSYERLAAIVQEVTDMRVSVITVSGGEPFLREKKDRSLTRLADRFKDRGFLVYTNGTMIDEKTADDLARVGNIFPAISIEGFEHQTDARRGEGIYGVNRRVRQLLAERGVMTGFSATVTRENVESICTDEFIDLRIAEGDMFGWFFLINPIGRSPRTDLMVTAEQRSLLRDTVYRWRAERRPILLGDFWNDGPVVGGCIAGGRYYFHIYANGDISPCVFSPIAVDNIFNIISGESEYNNLGELVEKHPVFVAFREGQKQIKDRARPCLLIDHPEVFRNICRTREYRPAKNMPPGYLDGEIASAIDERAEEWRRFVAEKLPPLPSQLEAMAEHAEAAPERTGACVP